MKVVLHINEKEHRFFLHFEDILAAWWAHDLFIHLVEGLQYAVG